MVNKKLGNEYENRCLKILQNMGFWCHLFSYNTNGQPCDIVAIKNNTPHLFDVKHCCESRFSFDKIQPNQLTCFEYANSCGVTNTGFVIWAETLCRWVYLDYQLVKKLMSQGEKSVKVEDLKRCLA